MESIFSGLTERKEEVEMNKYQFSKLCEEILREWKAGEEATLKEHVHKVYYHMMIGYVEDKAYQLFWNTFKNELRELGQHRKYTGGIAHAVIMEDFIYKFGNKWDYEDYELIVDMEEFWDIYKLNPMVILGIAEYMRWCEVTMINDKEMAILVLDEIPTSVTNFDNIFFAERASRSKFNTPQSYGFVYYIHTRLGTKIGKAKEFNKRTGNVSTIMPCEILRTDGFYVNDKDKAEKELHKLFKHKRGKGEWFKLSIDDMEQGEIFLQQNYKFQNYTKNIPYRETYEKLNFYVDKGEQIWYDEE